MSGQLVHVIIHGDAEPAGVACTRCGQQIKRPYYADDVPEPVCWHCQQRPCEGHSAFCHECQCPGNPDNPRRGMCRCGARWSGDQTCHCATCHLTFTSVGPFDAHRVGEMNDRRCLTPGELRKKGYEPNKYGRWRKPAPEGTFQGRNDDGA